MSDASSHSCLYAGRVEHRRLRPVAHHLSYKVFTLFVDLDELETLAKRLKFFSYNRFNLFSLRDRDHGRGDGQPLAQYVRELIASHAEAAQVKRICLLAYPRLFGYVFNPLSTYYCFDEKGLPVLMVYEVNNTSGDRTSYILPIEKGKIAQSHGKRMWVSPFNDVRGEYGFHGNIPDQHLSLGVSLRDQDGPKLKAWFTGDRVALSDGQLLKQFMRVPFLSFKIIVSILWEALKLKRKGLAYIRRPEPPASAFHGSQARNP